MGLLRYVARRLLLLIPVVLGVITITFFLSRVVPGNPAEMMLGAYHSNPEAVALMKQELGLDKPLLTQYGMYLLQLCKGDLGFSWHTGRPVFADIVDRFPATFELTTLSLSLSLIVGIPLGVLSVIQHNRLADHLSRLFALAGVATPSFWLGLLLIYFVYFRFDLVGAPVGQLSIGMAPPLHITGVYLVDSVLTGNWSVARDALSHLVLPVMTLSYATMAVVTRMVRSSMLEVLSQDYIRTARAKGLSERVVIFKHALRNAMIPTVTVMGLAYGSLLGGSVLVETIFSWPGIGSYAVDSIKWLDYAPVQGVTIMVAATYMLVNLLVDVAYSVVDVRIDFS